MNKKTHVWKEWLWQESLFDLADLSGLDRSSCKISTLSHSLFIELQNTELILNASNWAFKETVNTNKNKKIKLLNFTVAIIQQYNKIFGQQFIKVSVQNSFKL